MRVPKSLLGIIISLALSTSFGISHANECPVIDDVVGPKRLPESVVPHLWLNAPESAKGWSLTGLQWLALGEWNEANRAFRSAKQENSRDVH